MAGAKLCIQNDWQGLKRDFTLCCWVLETNLMNKQGKIILRIGATNFVGTILHNAEPLTACAIIFHHFLLRNQTFMSYQPISDEGSHSHLQYHIGWCKAWHLKWLTESSKMFITLGYCMYLKSLPSNKFLPSSAQASQPLSRWGLR